MSQIEVVAAVIECNNKILCVQRGIAKYPYLSNKWEFPGGKMEADESQQEAIKREIFEELNMYIVIHEKLLFVEHAYPDFHLKMHVYSCMSDDLPVLIEHQSYKWLTKSEIEFLDWAEADIPVVKFLISQA